MLHVLLADVQIQLKTGAKTKFYYLGLEKYLLSDGDRINTLLHYREESAGLTRPSKAASLQLLHDAT